MKKSEQTRRREAKAKNAKKLPETKRQNIASPIAVKTGRVEDDSQTTINPHAEENKKQGEKQPRPRVKAKRMSLIVSAIFISILFAVALVVASKGGSPTRIFWWSVAAVIFAEIGIGFMSLEKQQGRLLVPIPRYQLLQIVHGCPSRWFQMVHCCSVRVPLTCP